LFYFMRMLQRLDANILNQFILKIIHSRKFKIIIRTYLLNFLLILSHIPWLLTTNSFMTQANSAPFITFGSTSSLSILVNHSRHFPTITMWVFSFVILSGYTRNSSFNWLNVSSLLNELNIIQLTKTVHRLHEHVHIYRLFLLLIYIFQRVVVIRQLNIVFCYTWLYK
jgi:hypothetical protein